MDLSVNKYKLPELHIGNKTARLPIIQGGMGVGVSLSSLAGAVAKEGGVGIISTAQIGYDDEAYKYFSQSARMDLDDIHNNFYAGIHAANMAGTWQGIVFGFAGVRSNAGYLQINPKLPSQWKSYEFCLQYQGTNLTIKVAEREVE